MSKYYKLNDGSFAIIFTFDPNDDEFNTIERITDYKVEEVVLTRDEMKHYPGRIDNAEIRLSDKYGGIVHRYRSFEDLEQYHFVRDSMTKVFEEVFPLDAQGWDWDDVWWCNFRDTNSFHAFRDEDEYYILHKPSGTMINWYKHMGRTNTCNKNLSLEELKLFLLLLRKELVEEGIIKPEKGFEATKGLMK